MRTHICSHLRKALSKLAHSLKTMMGIHRILTQENPQLLSTCIHKAPNKIFHLNSPKGGLRSKYRKQTKKRKMKMNIPMMMSMNLNRHPLINLWELLNLRPKALALRVKLRLKASVLEVKALAHRDSSQWRRQQVCKDLTLSSTL